jgi:hypothetical protein
MRKTQAKGVSTNAFKKFMTAVLKAMFTPSDKADFMRLKNFIC